MRERERRIRDERRRRRRRSRKKRKKMKKKEEEEEKRRKKWRDKVQSQNWAQQRHHGTITI